MPWSPARCPTRIPVHKISIIPRGVGALGYVLSRPEEDRYLVTQSELESQIKVALGGTLAEELVYREISNGATSDLEQASRIARSMVKEFGMSRLGRVNFHERPDRLSSAARPATASATTASERPARSTWKCARSSTMRRRRCASAAGAPRRRWRRSRSG